MYCLASVILWVSGLRLSVGGRTPRCPPRRGGAAVFLAPWHPSCRPRRAPCRPVDDRPCPSAAHHFFWKKAGADNDDGRGAVPLLLVSKPMPVPGDSTSQSGARRRRCPIWGSRRPSSRRWSASPSVPRGLSSAAGRTLGDAEADVAGRTWLSLPPSALSSLSSAQDEEAGHAGGHDHGRGRDDGDELRPVAAAARRPAARLRAAGMGRPGGAGAPLRLLRIRVGLLVAGLLIRIRLLVPRLLVRVVLVLRVLLAPGRLLSWPHGQ